MKSCIVKRSFTAKALLPSITSIAVSLIVAAISVVIFPGLFIPLLAVGIIVAVVIAPGNIFTEYEYNIEGDSFSVALIRNKSSRKELFSCDMEHLISCEPYTGQNLGGIKLDYSEKGLNSYCITFSEENKLACIIFSPNDAFVRELFLLSPSKVKRNIM